MVVIRTTQVGGATRESLMAAVVAAGDRWSVGLRRLVRLVTELDRSVSWVTTDAPTCAHWVADALEIDVCTAREWIRIGRALNELPEIDAAFEDGSLSYSKVRTLTRVANPDNQAQLCALARDVPASRLRHALAAWFASHETATETENRHAKARHFTWRTDVDGMIVGSFRLAPAPGARTTTAIDALVTQKRPPHRHASADASQAGWHVRWPTIGQQRADALVELVSGGGAAVTTEIVMHVRGDGCTLDNGTPIAGTLVERIAPDAFLRALIHDAESRPINASGRQRHPSHRQRRVVKARDEACVDCGNTDFLEYDHDPDFNQSRRTVVDELRLRCWTCHRARHERLDEQR